MIERIFWKIEDMFWDYVESDRRKTNLEHTILSFCFYYLDYIDFVKEIKSDRGLSKVEDDDGSEVWTDENWWYCEFTYVYWIESPCRRIKDFIKYRVLRIEYVDPHLGCYSYPCCDEAPNGCIRVMGEDVEPYGYRDSPDDYESGDTK